MLLFDTQQIGNRLLAIRKRLGLTQSEAAELCGLSGRAYADIERGEVNMRIQTVQRICRAFHITPDEILTAENEPLAADQDALFARLQGCRPKEKETALALLASYIEEIKIGLLHIGQTAITLPDGAERLVQEASIVGFMEFYQINLMNPLVLVGVFIGAMMSFLFCGLTMNAVGRAAQSMVEEVRRQFREIKGILTGEGTPDYARCVAISTRGAQREMLFPSLLAIAAPVVVGLVFGVAGVMGLLVGGLSSGFVLAVFMANAGGAWDNAKKMVEEGHFGGKGSDCHRATVVGDTVGDPFKDTSGPSLNILIKLMSMVAIVMAGLTVAFHLF